PGGPGEQVRVPDRSHRIPAQVVHRYEDVRRSADDSKAVSLRLRGLIVVAAIPKDDAVPSALEPDAVLLRPRGAVVEARVALDDEVVDRPQVDSIFPVRVAQVTFEDQGGSPRRGAQTGGLDSVRRRAGDRVPANRPFARGREAASDVDSLAVHRERADSGAVDRVPLDQDVANAVRDLDARITRVEDVIPDDPMSRVRVRSAVAIDRDAVGESARLVEPRLEDLIPQDRVFVSLGRDDSVLPGAGGEAVRHDGLVGGDG